MPSENSPEMRKRDENARKNKNSNRPMTGAKGQMERDLAHLKKVGYTGLWEAANESEKARQVRDVAKVRSSVPGYEYNREMNKKTFVEDKRTGPKYAAAAAKVAAAKKNALKTSLKGMLKSKAK